MPTVTAQIERSHVERLSETVQKRLAAGRSSAEEGLRVEDVAGLEGRLSADEWQCLHFLVQFMPQVDVARLSLGYLMEHVQYSLKAREEFPWAKEVPWEVFLNDVLPYAYFDEPRESWRPVLYSHASKVLSVHPPSPSSLRAAAQLLNEYIWSTWEPPIVFVADRTPAVMSPLDVIEARNASCTGLSILIASACRSVGIPARVAGIPIWNTPAGGNHNWLEIWADGQWQFTGAHEYTPKGLDRGWFFPYPISTSQPGAGNHSIYATTFKPGGQGHDASAVFPVSWDWSVTYVHGVERTKWYLSLCPKEVVSGEGEVMAEGSRNDGGGAAEVVER
ncbi:unnamed protein product [Vitrella brassicaformis CCMP3155]|uniref:Transglutaminase-like domain-containing protein n=1 Tax=Vitrella brassicaformis (strain CCMP3155) TaxID=1169540 RepID=A0A0G4ERF8_VITBC|nr:unnamed protein product [Vitrella brassicaformis CCMP3155]|eukprot:CEM00019.1 unnamed protein product [Vitrella brassicaformis CCMP3155]